MDENKLTALKDAETPEFEVQHVEEDNEGAENLDHLDKNAAKQNHNIENKFDQMIEQNKNCLLTNPSMDET